MDRAEEVRPCRTAQSRRRVVGTASPSKSRISSETVETLRSSGARFRNDIVTGVGGKQILVEDPSGNPVELFEPILEEAKLSSS